MNKFLLSVAVIPAMALASDASAQTNVNAGGAVGVQNRIANLEARIDAGIQAGVIDRSEARNLRRQARDLRQLELSYNLNGLTRQERQTLQQRIRALRDQVRLAGGASWGNRYGWSDSDLDAYGYGQAYGNAGYTYDRYGNRVQTNTTITYDRYGNPVPSGYYGQGGPYEPAPAPRSSGVLGNVLGSGGAGILGSILGNGGLNIGDLITGTIGGALGGGSAVGYRDRSDVYFRTDGQRVYEIDARTNRVIRIHPAR